MKTKLTDSEIREFAVAVLQGMTNLKLNPRYPDGIVAIDDGGTVHFRTCKLVYRSTADGPIVMEVQDLSNFGDGWEWRGDTYQHEENIEGMVECLREWGCVDDAEETLYFLFEEGPNA